MCEFISWLKYDGRVLFLTDQDIQSSHGKDVLSFKDDDPVGHGAVRAYFSIKSGAGEEGECREIWNPGKFPEPIRSMLSDFDKHWSVMFSKYSDLRYIICYAPEAWKAKASEALLARKERGE